MTKSAHAIETAGTGKIIVSLTDGIYANGIDIACGVTKLTGAAPAGSQAETTVAAVRKGKLGSVVVSTVSSTGKRKSRRLVVSLEKLDTVIGEIVGKSIGSDRVTSARYPVRRRLR